jgi:hypothetical protein
LSSSTSGVVIGCDDTHTSSVSNFKLESNSPALTTSSTTIKITTNQHSEKCDKETKDEREAGEIVESDNESEKLYNNNKSNSNDNDNDNEYKIVNHHKNEKRMRENEYNFEYSSISLDQDENDDINVTSYSALDSSSTSTATTTTTTFNNFSCSHLHIAKRPRVCE